MVDKVDFISAPQKFAVQTPIAPAKTEKPQEDNKRNVDWKTIGAAGTAIAALVIGGIYWARSGKSSKTVDNAGQKLGEEVSNAAAKGEEALKKILPFEIDMDSPILKFVGKGRDIAEDDKLFNKINSHYLPDKLELNKVTDLPDRSRLFYSDDGKSFKYADIEGHFEFLKFEQETPVHGYKNIIECSDFDDGHCLFLYQKDDSTELVFDNSFNFNINIDNKTQKVLSAKACMEDISKENTENILKDFDINRYILNKNYRKSFNAKLSEFASIEKLAASYKKSAEEIKKLAQTPEYREIIKQAQTLRAPDTFISVKCISDNLDNIFGANEINRAFAYTSNLSESNIFNFINKQHDLLDVNTNSIVDATDSVGNFIKYRNGIRIRPKFCKIESSTGRITSNNLGFQLIEASSDGRYIRYKYGSGNEMVYINPKEITDEIPRLSQSINEDGLFEIKEYKDKNVFQFIDGEKEISIQYIPDSKEPVRAKSFIKDIKTSETQEISAEKETALKDLIEIFDFSKLSQNDYKTTLQGLIEEVLK